MAVNSTDYSDLQDAVRATLVSIIGSTGTAIIQDEAIRIHDGPVDLTPDSMAEWARTTHGPIVVVKIEGMTDEDDAADGGFNHPRRTWQTLEVALYLYDESLRGREPTKAEGVRGLSGTTNSPGIFKLINDVRASLSGYVAAVYTTDWEGPHWQTAAPVSTENDKHLWKLVGEYRGCVENSIDTSGLQAFVEVDADYNREGDSDNPMVEELISI